MTRSDLRAFLLKGVLVVAVNLLLLEALLQLLYWVTSGGGWLAARVSPPIYAFNPKLGIYGLRPDFTYRHKTSEFNVPIAIDGRAMRVAGDASRTAAPGSKSFDGLTVLASGPSYGFGWGSPYQEAYYPRMAALLGQRLGLPVRLLNISVPSQSSGLQLCRLQQEMAADRPDLVMITVYGGLQNLEPRCRKDSSLQVWNHQLVSGRPTLASRLKGLLRQSAIVFYSYSVYGALAGPGSSAAPMGQQDYRSQSDAQPLPQIEAYAAAVRRSLGPVSLLFVRVPYAYQVHPDHLARWRSNASPAVLAAQAAGEAAAWRQLRSDQAVLQRNGIFLLDPVPALQAQAGRGKQLYYRVDTHFTPAGNAVVAESLARDPGLPALLADVRRHRAASGRQP
ncbi:MAG: hypothetical protein VKM98_07550 [Cyanobacteriota bacterium]|nr:hypothetical protein [Cyanobacteriota bacterium]